MLQLTRVDHYVLVAYGLTFIVLAGYGLTIVVRRRQVDRQREAWSEGPRDPESGVVNAAD